MSAIGDWLGSLGLGEYTTAFEANAVAWDTLPDLDHALLKEIGVAAVGHRLRILKAIESIATAQDPAETSETVTEPPPGPSPPHTAPGDDAERRQLTVLFCDLVGSTALSSSLDPEITRRIILRYQDVCAGLIARFDGFLARFMGDGILAYFGYPRAHEDEAERAVRAGLALVRAVRDIETPTGEPLSARVGIATGVVVVGDLIGVGAAQEKAVVGDAPNLAARLQGAAEPGQVLIADATRQLLGAGFELVALGDRELRGLGKPMRLFAVSGEHTTDSRFEARHRGQLAAMVGRDQELALLLDRWRQARGGEGQMVLLTGEAGIGKSRITRALMDSVATEPHTRISYQCSPYQTDSALYPVVEHLRRATGFTAQDTNDARLDKLESLLAAGTTAVRAVAPLFAALMGLDGVSRYGALDMTPQQQRRRTMEALAEQSRGLATTQPVLLVIEDVHWIDPTTLELVELILDRIQDARVLVLATTRPTIQHSFQGHPIVTHLTLNRLGRSQIQGIVERLTGGAGLPEALFEEIVKRTDGVPLFVEELTKTIIESDVVRRTAHGYVLQGSLSEVAIPISLNDSLMARLDRLQPVKEVAQTAACIGRDFDYRTLRAVSPLGDDELGRALERLGEAELVFCRGKPPESTYTFKHALVRDAAYESLLRATRQQVHARILAAFEEAGDKPPEVCAQHAVEAGFREKAVPYWQEAGSAALKRSSYQEAIGHLRAAIELVRDLGDDRSWRSRELELQLLLGQAMTANLGYAAPATMAAFNEAARIESEVKDISNRLRALYGQWAGEYIACGATSELVAQFDAAAAQVEESGPRVIALRMQTLEALHAGRFEAALELVERALRAYAPDQHRGLGHVYAHDPRTAALNYRSWLKWFLGFPDQSDAAVVEAMRWADELGHANTQGIARCWGGVLLRVLQRDLQAAEARAEETVEFARERVMALWLSWSNVFLGWAQVQNRRDPAGLARIETALDELDRSNSARFKPWLLALLAESNSVLGRHAAALDVMRSSFEAQSATHDRALEPELYRIRGDIRARGEAPAERAQASADFDRAMTIARELHARSFELRAALSQAGLLRASGDDAAARALLSPILGSFTEGFGTPDLVGARAFLDAGA